GRPDRLDLRGWDPALVEHLPKIGFELRARAGQQRAGLGVERRGLADVGLLNLLTLLANLLAVLAQLERGRAGLVAGQLGGGLGLPDLALELGSALTLAGERRLSVEPPLP